MDATVIAGVLLTKLVRVTVPGGDVLQAMKCSDQGYTGFGEAYFTMVERGAVKGWKRHRRMTLNLVVPVGTVRFVIYDDRLHSPTHGQFQQVELSRANYYRLTVPPMVWMGFEGMGEAESVVMNVADIAHDPEEIERRALAEIEFDWSECP